MEQYMENNIDFVESIVEKWTQNKQKNSLDIFCSENPDNTFVIDIFPDQIKDMEKCCQVEVFYKRLLDKEIDKDRYIQLERIFVEFIKYSWLYNSMDVFYDLCFDAYFGKGIKAMRGWKKGQKSDTIKSITSWETLEYLTLLALREAGHLFIYSETQELMYIINGLSILVICKESEGVDEIRSYAKSLGLYIRNIVY